MDSAQKKACKPATLTRVWEATRRAISLHYSPAHQFALCQWQTSPRPTTAYVIYRWILFLTITSIGVASFSCQSLPKNYKGPPIQINYFKWFVYFTNWGFLMLMIQSGLALAVVHRFRAERNLSLPYTDEDGTNIRRSRSPLLCRLYWLAQSVAADLAFVITFIYWNLVHNPEIHEVNALNILVHAVNSIIMTIEISITSHPINAGHAIYGAGVGLVYGVFSAVYWAAGGTDKVGNSAVYPALNWNKPGSALGFVAMCACVLCFSHAIATAISYLRIRISKRIHKPSKPAPLTPVTIIQ